MHRAPVNQVNAGAYARWRAHNRESVKYKGSVWRVIHRGICGVQLHLVRAIRRPCCHWMVHDRRMVHVTTCQSSCMIYLFGNFSRPGCHLPLTGSLRNSSPFLPILKIKITRTRFLVLFPDTLLVQGDISNLPFSFPF